MPNFRYSQWDGTQQVFPIHEEDLMDHLSEQMVCYGDISKALHSLTQKGLQNKSGQSISGIQDMLKSLANRKQKALNKHSLEHVLDRIKEQLQGIVDMERAGIGKRIDHARNRLLSHPGRRESTPSVPPNTSSPTRQEMERLLEHLEEMGRRNLELLDNLPQDPARIIRQLQEYEFMDDKARAKFNKLLDSLRQQVLDSAFRNLARDLTAMGQGQLDSLKDMLRDLNRLMEKRLVAGDGGGDSASRSLFDGFMQKYGHLFGSRPPASTDELVQVLHQQAALMESLLKSLSPELRRDLEDVLSSIFSDPELQEEMARFAANLASLGSDGEPDGALAHEFPFRGSKPLGLQEALEVMEQLQRIEELEHQLKRAHQDNSLDHIDPALMRDILGEESCQDLELLRRMAEILENAGYIQQVGSGFELTPKGIHKIGHKALQEIFAYTKRDRLGHHSTSAEGGGGDLLEDTKRYEYGDPFHLDLQRSMMNAVLRSPGTPVRMQPGDFEVNHTEMVSQAATVLMVDLSLSMAMRGNFQSAKRVALALDNLIRMKFPKDSLYIVGFSTYAREVKADKLAYLSWDEADPYTNIQHGLAVARRLLGKSHAPTRQIIMISDGEPTAHIDDGQLFLQYPPTPRTIKETLKEVQRCTRQDIKINTFMLERSPYLVEFVGKMTGINRGRVFYTNPDKLGEYILADYLTSRRRQLA
jgi:uncharacterized protein with von Willebrand factor type A (vWA) domain